MIKSLYTWKLYWLEYFPKVYPNMSLEDFKDNNEKIIQDHLDAEINSSCNNYEWAREPDAEEYDAHARFMWEELTKDAKMINDRGLKPSKVKDMASKWLAKQVCDIMYKDQGMIHMPVWSPKDDRYLLFFVTLR